MTHDKRQVPIFSKRSSVLMQTVNHKASKGSLRLVVPLCGARLRKKTLNIEPDGLQHHRAHSVTLSDGSMTDSVFMHQAKV